MRHHHAPCQETPGWCLRPGEPPHCLCGRYYPQGCHGSHPILPGVTWQLIETLARYGVPFYQIATRTGVSLGIVRTVVHGVRHPRAEVRQP